MLQAMGRAVLLAALLAAPALAQPRVTTTHALSLLGEPKYGPDARALDYVNAEAPKGGDLRLYGIGGFDSLNPYIIKGEPAPGIAGFVYQTLMGGTLDDPSAEYPEIADTVEVPEDLSWVAFNLSPNARWHDGKPITAADVVFSFDILKEKGAPIYRFYYANVAKAEALAERKVRFHFSGPRNRELPQIMGQLPVLPKHWWASRDFERGGLEPPLGSGPYRVAAVEPNRSISFERVQDWWAKDRFPNVGRYNFATVRYDMYRDATVSLEAFKSGAYDFRNESSAKDWATAYDFPAVQNGQVIKAEIKHQRPSGMQAFVFNTRRPKFSDPRVRLALAHAFDFEWSNKNLFYDQYVRTNSFFENSEMQSRGLPSPAELKLLEPLRGQIPPEVFTQEYAPPKTDGSGTPRENLRTAIRLLGEAGWTIKNQRLVNAQGEPFEIEFLLVSPAFERVVAPYLRNLERLGIVGRIRTVDTAQYQNRVRDFDFDIIVQTFGQSESPGNEQRDFWSSAAAKRPGSRNVIGIDNPAVDRLVEAVIAAPDRDGLIAATRALDRVLLWNHYIVPQWHVNYDRIAYWNKLQPTGTHPKYGADLFAWWIKR